MTVHPAVVVAVSASLAALTALDLWFLDPAAFADRLLLAVAVGMLLWSLMRRGEAREGFSSPSCPAPDEPAPEDTADIDGLRPRLYASVFGPSPVTDGLWGRFQINQERATDTATQGDLAAGGVPLYNRSLHGPPVDDLGLPSTDRFTWALALRFNNFADFADTDLTTETLLQVETSTAGAGDFLVKLDVDPGGAAEGTSSSYATLRLTAGTQAASGSPGTLAFDPEQPYLLVVNRDGGDVSVRRYPLMAAPTSGQLGGAADVLAAEGVQQGLAPSNQRLRINVSGRLNANAYAVALFDTSLSATQEAQLQEYLERRIREAMDPGGRERGDCPYGPDVCSNRYCAGITDWSRPEQLIDSRVECKQAIVAYCEENPDRDACYCWDREDTRYDGEDCRRWRAFMGRGECKALESLTDHDVKRVKELYDLEERKCEAAAEEEPKTGIVNYYEDRPAGAPTARSGTTTASPG